MELSNHVLNDIIFQYKKLREQGERAISQVGKKYFFENLGEESNSIAILTKHIAGNMRSRWTDFLTSDGEKRFRDRPDEFRLDNEKSYQAYMKRWSESWDILYDTLEKLKPTDLMEIITIREENHTVVEALHRQLTHYAAHIGQVVFLAKHWLDEDWKTLSIPKDAVQFDDGSYKKDI